MMGYDPVDLQPAPGHTYPPNHESEHSMSIPLSNVHSSSSSRPDARPIQLPRAYDSEHAAGSIYRPQVESSNSWDVLSGMGRKIEHSYQEFDAARDASEPHLAFAEGDIPDNHASKLYNYLLNVSIVSRWILFIVPLLAVIWIPGVLVLTGTTPHAQVWGVGLLWWSIFLSVLWGGTQVRFDFMHITDQMVLLGWWAAAAISMILPRIIRRTLGVIAVGTRRYLDWLQVLHRYIALFFWTLAVFISYNPLINSRQVSTATKSSVEIIDLGQKLFFAFYLCATLLLFEKFSIQWIAGKFHERSYAERIRDQKFAVKSLVTLYMRSRNVGRPDGLNVESAKDVSHPANFIRRALKGVRSAATTTTTAFGNVASEIAGTSVLQPNSPQAIIQTSLESANRSRLLARRLFYSFVKPGADSWLAEDIARFFATADEADNAFALFDKDSNGDVTLEEVEMAIMEFHREQLSIEHSMQDLDSAVGRLDNIFMSLYVTLSFFFRNCTLDISAQVVIAILIIAVALQTQVATLVTSAGTLLLGLSWLIGGSLAEVLTSIIFLFIKHPFDVGDRVVIENVSYTVKEIRLLSTVFINSDGVLVQAPNLVLNGEFIQNIRRSPQMSETFTFDVHYSTSFEDVEKLRERMLKFVTTERRDYQPAFDVVVVDFPDQEKMTLSADIKYKSNGQQGALKAKRRNKWLCALKAALAEDGIYGPAGNPNAGPSTQRYTEVPWQEAKAESDKAKQRQENTTDGSTPAGGWRLSGQNAVILDGTDDIFSNPDDLHRTTPRPQRNPSQSTMMTPTASYTAPPTSSGRLP
ncbi:Mechanosensitive ion channel-domain-containing protein [Mycena pura]|uniref:Mechanosensitive ion channel protein n=1 Tax=Mycena pura TaxID=153505 RepID=A0AAD6VNE6_9AGAR|nr:Mechanosensitive ion channel-domain-containing protein [Mycena pura]